VSGGPRPRGHIIVGKGSKFLVPYFANEIAFVLVDIYGCLLSVGVVHQNSIAGHTKKIIMLEPADRFLRPSQGPMLNKKSCPILFSNNCNSLFLLLRRPTLNLNRYVLFRASIDGFDSHRLHHDSQWVTVNRSPQKILCNYFCN
jgi:hypothetical protein